MIDHRDDPTYERPTVEDLGTVEELTLVVVKAPTNLPDAHGFTIRTGS